MNIFRVDGRAMHPDWVDTVTGDAVELQGEQ
jgi:hypothetical protein